MTYKKKRMKKYALGALLALTLALASCGSPDPKEQIGRYKKQIADLEQKISALEGELDQDESGTGYAAAVNVVVRELEPEVFSRKFEVTGLMEALSDVYISPETSGQVESVPAKRGERVRKGQLLVRLDTDVIEKNIAEVKTNLSLATRLYEKQEELWSQKIGSELQYLEAKNNKEVLEARLATLEKQLQLASVTAPFSGIVEEVLVETGELASPGQRLIRLVNLDMMRVTSRISEAYLNRVSEGDRVELSFSAYPDWILTESISRLGEVIDPQTRTLTLEVELSNSDERLKPNMLTSVRIEDYRSEQALVVPSIALKEDFSGTFLFRVKESGGKTVAEKVYVETGLSVEDRTEITGGVEQGDLVIVRGYNLVGEGTLVSMVNE